MVILVRSFSYLWINILGHNKNILGSITGHSLITKLSFILCVLLPPPRVSDGSPLLPLGDPVPAGHGQAEESLENSGG